MRTTDCGNGTYLWSDFVLDALHEPSYWVFDLEATGANFAVDRVTQFGAIAIKDDRPNAESAFMQLVNPGKHIPEEIEALTGVTNESVKQAPMFPEAFAAFLDRPESHVWVTQAGYEFDVPMLLQECRRHNLMFPAVTVLDTKALFAYLNPERSGLFNTDFLLEHYGIDAACRQRHDALGDALLIADIFCAELAECRAKGITRIAIESPLVICKSWLSVVTPRLDWELPEFGS
jgi:DNA polymerase-3 subunit epsilon